MFLQIQKLGKVRYSKWSSCEVPGPHACTWQFNSSNDGTGQYRTWRIPHVVPQCHLNLVVLRWGGLSYCIIPCAIHFVLVEILKWAGPNVLYLQTTLTHAFRDYTFRVNHLGLWSIWNPRPPLRPLQWCLQRFWILCRACRRYSSFRYHSKILPWWCEMYGPAKAPYALLRWCL